MLNRNVADDDTVAIKVHQGRRPVAVANNSSVSAARIRSSSRKLEGRDSHKLADNNYGGLMATATKCMPPLPSAEIKRLSSCGFWAVLITAEYSNQAASIESQSVAGKGERVEMIAAS